ncbi:MAG: 2-C-methyl-D-erythritol 2,4-cyclodiphosphate synthase [Nitrospinota bacterium]
MIRIGTGYDVHAFSGGRPLVLGGVSIPFEKGLSGHSDADVLIHAVCDALLGALAIGDIGTHFPDTDPKYKNASSIGLLNEVAMMVGVNGYRVNNVDSVVVAQEPRLSPYTELMRKNIADAVGAELGQISVKCTTTEGLGFEGRKEGIAAQAAATLVEMPKA